MGSRTGGQTAEVLTLFFPFFACHPTMTASGRESMNQEFELPRVLTGVV
jgi:hypothetical protein